MLSQDCHTKMDIIYCLCEEVGSSDVDPILSFLKLLKCSNRDESSIENCKKILEEHKKMKMSACVECSSPPQTPTATSGMMCGSIFTSPSPFIVLTTEQTLTQSVEECSSSSVSPLHLSTHARPSCIAFRSEYKADSNLPSPLNSPSSI